MATSKVYGAVSVVLVWCLMLNGLSGRAFAVTRANDVTALKALYNHWNSNRGVNLNWIGDPCLNSWRGVVCDAANTTVISLSLDGLNLKGQLLPDIGGLTNLETLELSANEDLTGILPKELGNLEKLKTLSLQWCGFTGPLPAEIGKLVQLEFFGVNGNNLSGGIPEAVGNWRNLSWFDISTNQFTGPLPVSTTSRIGLDTMISVEHLHLNNNSLSGSVPKELFSLPKLIHLILDHNDLSGQIPPEVGISKSLQIIRFDYNQLNGSIPSAITNATSLTDLNFRHNKLSGTVPDLSLLINLEGLDLGENNYDKQLFPSWVLNDTKLITLSMRSSNIEGQLPPAVFALEQIETLDLQNNQINGSLTFPGAVSKTLSTIVLDNNQINGFVGQPENDATTHITISLYNNPLCSNEYIQPTGGSCVPYDPAGYMGLAGNCTNDCGKKTLNPKTCFCGYPLELNIMLTAPSFLNLTDSMSTLLEAELATEITQNGLNNLKLEPAQVWIQSASTTPDSRISLMVYFFPASASSNSLSQQERDDIVHTIRQHKFSLTAGPYNLPEDIFRVVKASAVLSTVAIVFIAIGAAAGVLLFVAVIICAVRERRSAIKARNPFASWGDGKDAAPKLKNARAFSLAELASATNNWNEVLGEGGYGKVYKGTLKNGEIVAIKRANKDSMQGLAEFKNELELLSRVHHRNLVDLLGFCYESGEQCLVYEFMSNGTLRESLYERLETPLSWKTRLEIILDSARGLAYLHDHANPPIIHGDIKSANILLNHKMVAKVADFGLSKPTSDDGDKILYSDEIKGTRGYLDPEYFQTHIHTDKSDVFSFGVVMVEAVTGKSPTHGGKDRTRELRNAWEAEGVAGVRPLMDPFVQGIPDDELEIYLTVALRCTEGLGEDRPTMTEVVKELEAILSGGSLQRSGVQKPHKLGNKSPELYSDTASLVNTATTSSSDKGKEDQENFQYSGAYGVTITVQPK